MRVNTRFLATAELLLILPAVLFMTSLLLQSIQPLQYEPAHSAQEIVNWYAARPHVGLWILLMGLPMVVLVTGSMAIWRRWSRESELRQSAGEAWAMVAKHGATLALAGATFTAAGMLGIVALHVLTD